MSRRPPAAAPATRVRPRFATSVPSPAPSPPAPRRSSATSSPSACSAYRDGKSATMDFAFSDEQTALRGSARAMLERHCSTAVVRDLIERGIAPEPLWARMVGLDWPALAITESAGGVGQGFIEVAVLLEELGRVIAPGPFLATVTQFAPLVRECGTPEQRDRLLRAVAAGTTGTLAISGPAGDWRPDRAALTARPRPGGGWLLDGSVHHVLDSGAAETAVVARLDAAGDGDGTAAFVVPRGAARSDPVQTLDLSRPLTTLRFESLTVPD